MTAHKRNFITAGLITIAFIGIIMFSGPITALNVTITPDHSSYMKGSSIATFRANLTITNGENVPVQLVKLGIQAPGSPIVYCNLPSVNTNNYNCGGRIINVTVTSVNYTGNYGYGYREASFNSSMYSWGYGYGYGGSSSTLLGYVIRWAVPGCAPSGTYTASFIVIAQNDKTFTGYSSFTVSGHEKPTTTTTTRRTTTTTKRTTTSTTRRPTTTTTTTSSTTTTRPNQVTVYGWVKKQNKFQPVAGANVSVYCLANGKNVSTRTNYRGTYTVRIDCPYNSKVRVDGSSDGYYGSDNERVRSGFVEADVYLRHESWDTTTTSTTTSSTTTSTTSSSTSTSTTTSNTSTSTTMPTSTTTTTMHHATTTTSTLPGCVMPGNSPPCSDISIREVLTSIRAWSRGDMSMDDVIALLNSWRNPARYPAN